MNLTERNERWTIVPFFSNPRHWQNVPEIEGGEYSTIDWLIWTFIVVNEIAVIEQPEIWMSKHHNLQLFSKYM